MRVPLTVADQLERAALVYPDRGRDRGRTGTRPAAGWARSRTASVAELARAQAAMLDERGIVLPASACAVVSHNSARLFVSYFGVSAFGRVLVPVNFPPQQRGESATSSSTAGRRCCCSTLSSRTTLAASSGKHKIMLGTRDRRRDLPRGREPKPWTNPDEDDTGTINYRAVPLLGPRASKLTHRNLWVNSTTFGWHTSVSDRDTYLHTLPMFHCNGWGMPHALTAMGGRRRSCCARSDGNDILRRIDEHGVTLLCGAPAVGRRGARRRVDVGRTDPGRGGVPRIVVAVPPPPTRTIERVEPELGWEFIQIYGLTETAPLLDDQSGSRRVRRALAGRSGREAGARRRARARGPHHDQ